MSTRSSQSRNRRDHTQRTLEISLKPLPSPPEPAAPTRTLPRSAAVARAAHAAATRCLSPPHWPAASLVCHRNAHRLAASCPPFRMSARSAWACHTHSEPQRCRHPMPPQLQ
ncbi:hypothetical protein ACLOJK_006487 [Asimina triloba]